VVSFIIFLALFVVFMTQGWKITKKVSPLVRHYRVNKPVGLKFSWCGCGVRRKDLLDVWDGFGEAATTDEGIYYRSWGTPYLFFPWQSLTLINTKRLFPFRKYNFIKIKEFGDVTWLLSASIDLGSKLQHNKKINKDT
jgi:hypothetical protein